MIALSITKRLILDFIKYKSNNGHSFFMSNEKIGAAINIKPSSAKVMINELVRLGYLYRDTDNKGRRTLALTGKAYNSIACVDLSTFDKRTIAMEAINNQRDLEYYKKELELANIRINALEDEISKLRLQNIAPAPQNI